MKQTKNIRWQDMQLAPAPKLSALIREGAKHCVQSHDGWVHHEKGAVCALTCAVMAVTGNYQEPFPVFDALARAGVNIHEKIYIEEWGGRVSIKNAVMVFNDRYGWKYEEIADWLEGRGL